MCTPIPMDKVMTRHHNKFEDNPGVTSKPRYETCADLDAASPVDVHAPDACEPEAPLLFAALLGAQQRRLQQALSKMGDLEAGAAISKGEIREMPGSASSSPSDDQSLTVPSWDATRTSAWRGCHARDVAAARVDAREGIQSLAVELRKATAVADDAKGEVMKELNTLWQLMESIESEADGVKMTTDGDRKSVV